MFERNDITKEVSSFHVHWSITHTSQNMETTQVPTDVWTDKEKRNTYKMYITPSQHKKKILPSLSTWMNPEDNYGQWNLSDKDKYCLISLSCGILKKPNPSKQRVDWC